MRFSFANRRPELAEVTQFVRDRSEPLGAKVCIVSGPSGVGKSRFVDEAASSPGFGSNYTRVQVTLPEIHLAGESGFFLRASAVAISDANKKRGGPTLEAYARSRGGLATLWAALGAGVKKAETVATGGSELSADALTAVQEEHRALKELLGEPSIAALRLASNYLGKAATNGSMILALENAQFIDPESNHYLMEILRAAPSARIIFEYTEASEGGGDTLPYSELRDSCLASGLGLLEIPLQPLAFETLRRHNLGRYDSHFVEELRLGYSGNVRDLERRVAIVSGRVVSGHKFEHSGIRDALLNFSPAQKVTLWIVALSRGNLDPFELTEIASFIRPEFRPADPVQTAKSLSPFVEMRDGLFTIDHDSLLPRLEALEPIRRDALVAAQGAADYYQSFLSRDDYRRHSEYEILFALLRLSLILNSSDIADLAITRLSAGAQKGGRPAGILRLANDFSRAAGGLALHETTIRRLIGIIYDACWLEGAVELVRDHCKLGLDVRLSYCQALGLTSNHVEAEREWQGLSESLRLTSMPESKKRRIQAYAGLTGVLICRLRGDYPEARRRYDSLSHSDFDRADDLSVYHRFGEVADVAGVPQHLEKSRELALGLGDPTHLIRANITLSIPTAERGDLQRALELLDEAASLEPLSYVDDYMIAHNRLVTEMYAGEPSSATYHRLDELLPLVIDSMDRVLIGNILLAASTAFGHEGAADRYAGLIRDSLPHVVEPNIRRGSLFNCGHYYGRRSDDSIARSFRDEAFATRVGFDEDYWQARQTGSRDRRRDFRLVSEFDLPMMTNWYFSWPDFDTMPG
jgi:hypothetical protein